MVATRKRARVAGGTPSVLSTFTGLGGLDLGLEASGFRSLGCVEIDPTARRSLKTNRDNWSVLSPHDITALAESLSPRDFEIGRGELTLLAGAPPCQPYSKAAMWAPGACSGLADERATPLFSFLELAERFLPSAIAIENVAGFVRGRNSALHAIHDALNAINGRHGTNYAAEVRILDAADYGVPQRRQRAIVVAFRDGEVMKWPEPTHQITPVRAWDALCGIVDRSAAPTMQGRWADLLPSIPEGCNYLWHTNRGGGRPLFGYRTRFWSFLLKLAKGQPSWTLPAQPGPSVGPFHWENRPLRVSEMLRLQSFPESWHVEGTRREQVMQIGNATPPLLAEVLGRCVQESLGAVASAAPLTLAIERASVVPKAERLRPVPAKFLILAGSHDDHPGSGLGPRPRAAV